MSNSHDNNMFINLISDRPANIAKALRFGRKFQGAGWKVFLSVNIDAVTLVKPGTDLGPCPVTGNSLVQMLADFHSEGGRVLVGKECLGQAGISPDQLPEGYEVAALPMTMEIMSLPDLKIITW